MVEIKELCSLSDESWSTPCFCNDKSLLIVADRSGKISALDIKDNAVVWSVYLEFVVTSSPVIIENENRAVVLIGCEVSGELFALKLRTGEKSWSIKLGQSIRSTPQLIPDSPGHFIVAAYGNYLYRLTIEGKILWRRFLGKHIYSGALGVVSSPLIADVNNDGKLEVVIGTRNRMVVCVSCDSGKFLWFYSIYSDPDSSPSLAFLSGKPIILVGGGEFTNGRGDLSLHAIDGMSGARFWKSQIGGGLDSCPVIRKVKNEKLVYITSLADHSCYCFKLEDGSVLWRKSFNKTDKCFSEHDLCFTNNKYFTEDAVCRSYTTPLVVDFMNKSVVIVGSNNGQFYILDAMSGDEVFSNVFDTGPLRASPIHIKYEQKNSLIIVSGDKVYSIRSDYFNNTGGTKSSFNVLHNSLLENYKVITSSKYFRIKIWMLFKFYFHLIVIDLFRYIFNVIDVRIGTSILVKNQDNSYVNSD